jgi:hypothetical protein
MDPVSKAQLGDSTGVSARQRSNANLKRYPKGISGNPGGRRKKPFQEIIDKFMEKKANREEIGSVMMDIVRSRRMASVLMLREIAERMDGKVVQPVEMGGNLTISLEQVLEAKKKAGK